MSHPCLRFITLLYENVIVFSRKNAYNNSNFDGNIVRNTEELIEEIKNIKEYDYSNQKDFKEKYLTNCTGESSKNIVDYMINN